ncbi:MAG: SH3 domain-containing protein [Flavobacteriaceae bacterium]|nr:SH3 domain-containing protein [Flavobacteriaceae bacterium]
MKTVKFLSLALVCSIAFISCKNETTTTQNEIESNDLAIAETTIPDTSVSYLYVTASTGLSLREYNNLQSDKIGLMPYGTKVKIISTEENSTMTIGGIKGGMDEIEFNHKKGFAFNGYLSKFFPPERDISAKGYAEELQNAYKGVIYSETNGGSVSAPTNTETLVLPTNQWHEAFYIAKEIFSIPSEFTFPKQKGKDHKVIQGKKPENGVMVCELHISRKDNTLETIEYKYKTKKFESTVTIIKNGEKMKISKTEKII